MKILVVGGTRFFGIETVRDLLTARHNVTIATRGMTKDQFGSSVNRIKLNLYNPISCKEALDGKEFDVVIDKMGYGPADLKNILENISCKYIIHMSTAGVYAPYMNKEGIQESEFAPENYHYQWLSRGESDYDELKRMAEAALSQYWQGVKWTALRAPIVLGQNDYTNRLRFYIEHIYAGKSMYIDNLEARFSVAYSTDVGAITAALVERPVYGPLNICSKGYLSISKLLDYISKMVNKHPVLSVDGDPAPYNGQQSNSLSIEKLENAGFKTTAVAEWLPGLVDAIISETIASSKFQTISKEQ